MYQLKIPCKTMHLSLALIRIILRKEIENVIKIWEPNGTLGVILSSPSFHKTLMSDQVLCHLLEMRENLEWNVISAHSISICTLNSFFSINLPVPCFLHTHFLMHLDPWLHSLSPGCKIFSFLSKCSFSLYLATVTSCPSVESHFLKEDFFSVHFSLPIYFLNYCNCVLHL